MKKMNNKGFAVSTVLYSLLVMAALILFLLIGNLSFERKSTNDFVSNIEDELNSFAGEQTSKMLSSVLLAKPGEKGSTYDDGTDTFITGEEPNNYVWYSNRMWRAVLVNNASETVKIVTEENASTMTFSQTGATNFANSDIIKWLNDTNAAGFFGTLNNYQDFIVTDSEWFIEVSLNNIRPEGTTVVSNVGLLNNYEFDNSHIGSPASSSYLINNTDWWTLTRWDVSPNILVIEAGGELGINSPSDSYGVRPAINLKADVTITGGDGTLANPYTLDGDLAE